MKINLIKFIDIFLVLLISYFLILRGNMPSLCLKSFIIAIVGYHLFMKYYKVEKYLVNVSLPESFEFIEDLVNGKTVKKTTDSKFEKVEDFLKTKDPYTYREPEIMSESFSDF